EIFTEAQLDGLLQTKVKVPELIAFNPKYVGDQKLIERIEKKLGSEFPDDLFIMQDAVTETVVTDDVLDVLFRIGGNKVKMVADILGTWTIRPVCKDVITA